MSSDTWDDEDPEKFRMPNQNESRPHRSKKDTRLTKDKFEEYLRLKSEYALMQLTRGNGGLKNFLQDTAKSTDIAVVAVRCFSHACQCDLLEKDKNFFLTSVLESSFIETDLAIYATTVSKLSSEFADACADIILRLLNKMPDESAKKVTLLWHRLYELGNWSEVTMRKLTTIQDLLASSATSDQEQQPKRRPDNDDDIPPEDFRILTTIPLESDLDVNKQPFLRKNRTGSRYDTCDQYLDVQFRLLREDLFAPLRQGISEYQSHGGNTSHPMSSLKVYLNVRLVRPICRNNGLAYRISFDVNKMAKVHWETSKRLIFGSLLCLSKDNFQNCVYATVVNKDTKDVKNGLIDVSFEFLEVGEMNEFVQSNRKSKFAMVESPSYYEPYKHVLLAMQRMGEGNFPFQRYVVECANDIKLPAYLINNPRAMYDLRPLVDPKYTVSDLDDRYVFDPVLDSFKDVDIQNDSAWPNHQQLGLDLSQSVALRQALCREFSVIQGPPGTGKTHLGLGILKLLIHNNHIWSSTDSLPVPIVVICYTNHALDQFLVGALDFFKGKMVRVGSRSQDDRIKEFNITHHRTRARETKQVSQAIHNSRFQIRIELENLKSEIDRTAVQLQIAQREILHEHCFEQRSINRTSLLRQMGPDNDKLRMLRWLGIQNRLDALQREDEGHEDEEYDTDDGDEDEELDVLERVRDSRIIDDDDLFAEIDHEMDNLKMQSTLLDISSLGEHHIIDSTAPDETRRLAEYKQRETRKLKRFLQFNVSSDDCMSDAEAAKIQNLRHMKYKDRWRLYRYWIRQFIDKVVDELKEREQEYEDKAKRYRDILLIEDRDIIRNATLVGLTTTGAAKYQSVLADIGPKIIIFEEAAEVLEGHIVVNLCRQCEHAIFIGDHKQLQPNPTVHKLAKDYNLDISLFERLIKNNLPYDTLNLQHRMRPEISSIIRVIYPKLKDHDIVKAYENIRGVENNIAFVNHSNPDEQNEETKSHANKFEAEYLKAFCGYLIKQGYEKHKITVLTFYSGQQEYMSSIFTKPKYANIRIATVDSFQGQENDIVLLSMVRSSQEDSIGFLAKENRLCVAFSRAKMGFYVIGNFEHLQKHSTLLKEIVSKASCSRIIHKGLNLGCQFHDKTRLAVHPDDFNVSTGGCMEPCNHRLSCGHACPLLCHSDDRKHDHIKCIEDCIRQCDNGHACSKPCYEECSPCMFPKKKTIPQCGHEQMVPCSEEPWTFECKAQSTKTLPCGHKGQGPCSPHLTADCMEKIEVKRVCGHTTEISCHEKDEDTCYHPCDTILECEHPCSGTCSQCFKGRLHMPCQKPCGRDLVCGHVCMDVCSFCPPCSEACINKCKHNQCPNKCGEECTPCNMACKWRCRHFICTKRCSEECDRKRCDEPCRKCLPCKHICIGLCGETCPSLCRICDHSDIEGFHIWGTENVKSSQYIMLEDCGHIIEVKGMDAYMEAENSDEDEIISMKRCPFCKVSIVTTPRYGNIVKQELKRIQNVKRKIMGDSNRIPKLLKLIDEKTRRSETMKQFVRKLYDPDDTIKSEHILATVASQINIFEQIMLLRSQLKKTTGQLQLEKECFKNILNWIDDLEAWTSVKRTIFSTQEGGDAKSEVVRLRNLVRLSIGREKASERPDVVPAIFMNRLVALIWSLDINQQGLQKDVDDMLQTLSDYIPDSTLGVTNDEKLQIVQAIGGRKGEWYQCRNGHYYSIGDCGRPTETARCPECNQTIGGEDHAFVPGNVQAPEMDDAEGPLHTEQSDYELALLLQFGEHY